MAIGLEKKDTLFYYALFLECVKNSEFTIG